MSVDTLAVELLVTDDKAEVVLSKNKQRLEDFQRTAEKIQPQIKFSIPNQNYIDLDRLEKRAADTAGTFQNIAKTRLDGGQVTNLTREIVRASERADALAADISSIKKELANPNRKSSIAFLTEELRAAEREADGLNRKLSALPGAGAGRGTTGAANLQLSSFQKTNLSYQVNDIATMAAMGANPTQIIASQGGQIAQIFSAEQISAFAAAYSGLLPILGAGTAAIALTYKITGDIRADAERRLKTEEKITATLNKQRLETLEITKAITAQRKEAAASRDLQFYQQTTPIEQIRGRLDLLKKLESMTPKEQPNVAKLKEYATEILALEDQIDNFDKKQKIARQEDPKKAFDQNFENYKKMQEERLQFEREQAEKFRQSVEKGKEKVNELGNTYNDLFNSLYQRTNQKNPFVSLFTEADTSIKRLVENTRGLSKDLISQFEQMEAKANSLKLFEARLSNNLSAFDLRDQATDFRNKTAARPEAEVKAEQDRLVEDYLRKNPNFLFLEGKKEVDESSRLKILQSSALGRSTLETANPFQSMQERLERQLAIIYGGNLSADELGVADRRVISLTSGANPLELTSRQREAAAVAREREAVRLESGEKDAKAQREKSLKVQEQIREELQKLNKIAEKDGIAGIKNIVEIVDRSNGAARVLGASPRPEDMVGDIFGFKQ